MQMDHEAAAKKELSILPDSVQSFADELHERDEVLLSKYSFTFQDRRLTMDEAKSFLAFVRSQLSSK